jgi:hypothetical protein
LGRKRSLLGSPVNGAILIPHRSSQLAARRVPHLDAEGYAGRDAEHDHQFSLQVAENTSAFDSKGSSEIASKDGVTRSIDRRLPKRGS